MRRIAAIASLNLIAVAIYVVVAVDVGFFSHISDSLFSSPDSHSYREVADWLFGGPNTIESGHRPFFYPLLLGIAQRLDGAPGIWALNFVCWLGMLNATAAATWRMTRRWWMGGLVFLLLATNVSIIALTFQALTEPLVAFLEALWILGVALCTMPSARPRHIAMLLLPIALLAVVKPSYQFELGIAIVLLAITVSRMPRGRVVAAAALVACCTPVTIQLGLNLSANHFFGLSSTGDNEFRNYYVAQVYAEVHGLPNDLTAARTAVGALTTSQEIEFLLDHRGLALSTLFSNLHGNLASPSPFIDPSQHPNLWSVTRDTNRAYLRLHLLFLPVIALALWRRRDVRLLLLYGFTAILILLPSLIYDQGDRYIDMALPLWASAYALAVVELLPDVSNVVQRLRGKAPSTYVPRSEEAG
jgi:hypothetical protein